MREPRTSRSAADEALMGAFHASAAAEPAAVSRVRAAALRRAAAESAAPRLGWRALARRPLLAGSVVGLVLVALVTAVFVLGDARTPSGEYVIERARAAQAEARQRGKITHERIRETYWERDDLAQGTSLDDVDRSMALTGTVITETWRNYEGSRSRVEQWVDRDGERFWPMTFVREGEWSQRSIETSAGIDLSEWLGMPSELDDRPIFRIHKAVATPAFIQCSVCHSVTAESDETAGEGFSDEASLVQSLLRLGFLENAGRGSHRGQEVWVLRSEGTTRSADAPNAGRSRWLLEMYVESGTYRLLGARNRTWQGAPGRPMTLQHEWTFDLEVSEALAEYDVRNDLFAARYPSDARPGRYAAKIAIGSTGGYSVLPLYWLGPEVAGAPFPDSSEAARPLEPWFTVRSPESDSWSLIDTVPGSALVTPALTASIEYLLPGEDSGGNTLVVRTYPPLSSDVIAKSVGLEPDDRVVTTTLAGKPVTLIQTRERSGVPPADSFTTLAFFIHFPEATVTIDDPRPPRLVGGLTTETIAAIVGRLRRSD